MTFTDFLAPLDADNFGSDNGQVNTYHSQVKKHITEFPDLDDIDIVMLGVNELRNRNNQHDLVWCLQGRKRMKLAIFYYR